MYVHESQREKLIARGFVQVGEERGWFHFVNPEITCLREMRTGKCLMDKGHRGRCSTVVFNCDCCGKTRRGRPHGESANPADGVVEIVWCFMCDRERLDSALVKEFGYNPFR